MQTSFFFFDPSVEAASKNLTEIHTFLPSGHLENKGFLQQGQGVKGLARKQDLAAAGGFEDHEHFHKYSWQREDGTRAVVRLYPATLRETADKEVHCTQWTSEHKEAFKEFKQALINVFGREVVKEECIQMYRSEGNRHNFMAVGGTKDALLVQTSFFFFDPSREAASKNLTEIHTFLPSGHLENKGFLQQGQGVKGLARKQDLAAASSSASNVKDHNIFEKYSWQREDGTRAVVRLYPATLRKNADKAVDRDQRTSEQNEAFEEFKQALINVFGREVVKEECIQMYRSEGSRHDFLAVGGTKDALLDLIVSRQPKLMRHYFGIEQTSENSITVFRTSRSKRIGFCRSKKFWPFLQNDDQMYVLFNQEGGASSSGWIQTRDEFAMGKIPEVVERHLELRQHTGFQQLFPVDFLGEGGFGTVFKVYAKGSERDQEEVLALKLFKKRHLLDQRVKSMVDSEVKMGQTLKHDNILKTFCQVEIYMDTAIMVDITRKILCGYEYGILMDLAHPWNLDKYILEKKECTVEGKKLDWEYWKFCRAALLDMTSAVSYMHYKECVHRDIKTSNFLLQLKKEGAGNGAVGSVCLSDFGHACKSTAVDDRVPGSRDYMPPELKKFWPSSNVSADEIQRINWTACDMFSLGRSLRAVLCRKRKQDRDSQWLDPLNYGESTEALRISWPRKVVWLVTSLTRCLPSEREFERLNKDDLPCSKEGFEQMLKARRSRRDDMLGNMKSLPHFDVSIMSYIVLHGCTLHDPIFAEILSTRVPILMLRMDSCNK